MGPCDLSSTFILQHRIQPLFKGLISFYLQDYIDIVLCAKLMTEMAELSLWICRFDAKLNRTACI